MANYPLLGGGIVEIEHARGDDAAEILQFVQLAAAESDFLLSGPEDFALEVEQERAWLEHQAALPRNVVLAAKVGGRVGAIASVASPPQKRAAHTGEISIMVGRALWGRGVGRALMAELLGFSRSVGLLLLHLGVRSDNARAIALYRRFGFLEAGRLPDYFNIDGRCEDEVLMALKLG